MGRQARQSKQTASAGSSHPPRSGAAIGRWAALGGSTTVLVLASLVADGLAFGAKQACRTGAWNLGDDQPGQAPGGENREVAPPRPPAAGRSRW